MNASSSSCFCRWGIVVALGGLLMLGACAKKPDADEFLRLMNVGKALYEQGDAARAVQVFSQAVTLAPTQTDARLNLANAYLRVGSPQEAALQGEEVLRIEPNSAAAHFLVGCARLRSGQFAEAIKALQTAKDIDQTVNAVSFQLGRAYAGAGKFEDAALQFNEVTQFETNHPAASYQLSQVLIRLGRTDEARQALEVHQQILSQRGNPPTDESTFEQCVYTQIKTPFELAQPDPTGVRVRFSDATAEFFGAAAQNFRGPIAVLDINHRGTNDLFVREGDTGFRLLMNTGGKFSPQGAPLPVNPAATYSRALVGDLDNDQHEDVIVLGDRGVSAFRFTTNGAITDATIFANLTNTPAVDGQLVDLDFTGKLDLLLTPPGSNAVRVLRNLGGMYFMEVTATSGVPNSVSSPRQIALEDWNNDDVQDVLIARVGQPPLLLIKQRGGTLAVSNTPASWPSARIIASGDLNNDLRSDLVFVTDAQIACVFNGLTNGVTIPLSGFEVNQLALLDYDNDGWLDVIGFGRGARVWRNLGLAGFHDVTTALGLEALANDTIESFAFADFDNDCDTDLLLSLAGRGLRMWRNDGGNQNRQLKLRLHGTRSNTSALGVRVEVTAGHWRTLRTVQRLPFEIGVGRAAQLDSLNVRWFDIAWNQAEVSVTNCSTLSMIELTIPTGSCPYLYGWNGERFQFLTDLLCSAPLGLPVAEGRYIEADTDEYVWLGNENRFKSRNGFFQLQITEELREVLYLDEAKLVVVDHPPGAEIYPTDKLLPGAPFPPSELVTLHRPRPLLRATRHDGLDATELLQEADGRYVSPTARRLPQLRGLAEPHSVTLDFGPLNVERQLVLGLTGWLRFGGGMANISASHDPNLPFPFPVLEVQTAEGRWQKVDVSPGAPNGRGKRFFVDLSGKLPPGSRQFRLSAAFEIHWDQAVLFEKAEAVEARRTVMIPDQTDLHWHGFNEFLDLPWEQPPTPDYGQVHSRPYWRITPSGWCTRYGEVDELIARRDDALVLINGGDELTLRFRADKLPPKPAGYVRDFFVYLVGWDKDADFHVKHGTTVDPLPYHGMDYQRYGDAPRPAHLSAADALMEKYNTRWVGPMTFSRAERAGPGRR